MKEDDRGILYVYAEPKNEEHVEKLAKKHNIKKSQVVNKIIESHRTGNPAKFSTRVPKYVQRAKEWEEKTKVD